MKTTRNTNSNAKNNTHHAANNRNTFCAKSIDRKTSASEAS